MNLHSLTIHELHEKLKNKEISSVELTESIFQRIAATEEKLHSFITLCHESARAEAKKADELLSKDGAITPLSGIPVAVKDIFLTQGVMTTCGSKILANFHSPYDGTAVKKLKETGTITVGKTNMDEFAMGSSTENSAFSLTRNPWNLDCVPGGSSGGSAAAVAGDQCIAALGTDTGGSIRQPAACCGIVGLKPTYGRVSRFGIIAFASSLDQVGPLSKDITDCALLLETIAGYDPLDSTSVKSPVPSYISSLSNDARGLRIGIPKEYFVSGMQPEVENAVREGVRVLERSGIIVKEISLPHTEYAVAAYYIIAPAEASSNLARYDGMRYGYRSTAKDLTETYMKSREKGFGAEVKRRIMLGTYVLSAGYYNAYYLKAQKVRTLIKKDFDEAFKSCDAIITPTAPTTAFKIGEKTQDPLQMYLTDIFTLPASLAGLPALSLPCGFDAKGLPIGMQVMGKYFDEATILRIGYAFEQATDWHRRKPPL